MKRPRKPRKPNKPEKIIKGKRLMPAVHEFGSVLTIECFKEAAQELRCTPDSLCFNLNVDYPFYSDESIHSDFYWVTFEETENSNYEKEMKAYEKKLKVYKEKSKKYKEDLKKYKEDMKAWEEIDRQQTILDLKKQLQELEK